MSVNVLQQLAPAHHRHTMVYTANSTYGTQISSPPGFSGTVTPSVRRVVKTWSAKDASYSSSGISSNCFMLSAKNVSTSRRSDMSGCSPICTQREPCRMSAQYSTNNQLKCAGHPTHTQITQHVPTASTQQTEGPTQGGSASGRRLPSDCQGTRTWPGAEVWWRRGSTHTCHCGNGVNGQCSSQPQIPDAL